MLSLHYPAGVCDRSRGYLPGGGALHLAATGRKVYTALAALAAFIGSFFSIKQLWLQNLPEDKVPACGPPVDYLFDACIEAISMLLRGDVAVPVQWQFLRLYPAGCWSALPALPCWLFSVFPQVIPAGANAEAAFLFGSPWL